jgi:LysM repeat protein
MGKKIKIKAYDGSTMSNLAEILGTTVEELKKYNNLDSNIVKVGQEFSWETDDVEGIKSRLSKVQNRLQ